MQRYRCTIILVQIGLTLVYSLFMVLFSISFLAIQQFAEISELLGILGVLYIIFSWYWTTQVIKNAGGIIFGTLSGKWYLHSTSPSQNLKSGINRLVESSMGSVCLGSLLVPPFSIFYF